MTIMKKIMTITAAVFFFTAIASADDRHVDVNRLPETIKTFLNTNYPSVQILYSTKDDDLIRPEYNVALENGVRLEFHNDGTLKQIEAKDGVPSSLIPAQIVQFVKGRYPDAHVTGYEVDRRHYEIKLSNRMELKFSKNYNLIEIDD